MNITPIQKGSTILRPRARLIKTIGEELISSDIVAILELVKNSYDADAELIVIKFDGIVETRVEGKKNNRVLIKNSSSLLIEDDGSGMSLDVIKNAWMEPATIMKKINKTSSKKIRRYTGEKGIGRFASAKLASNLKIISRIQDDNQITAQFNWEDFAEDSKYLDEVNCQWEVQEPNEIKKSGTILSLNNLNSEWNEDKIRQLRITLSRLINPLSPALDFLIDLQLPKELHDLSGIIEPPTSLLTPSYTVKGNINSEGLGTLYYSSVNTPEQKFEVDFKNEIRPIRNIQTGPFDFEFNVWDRDNESLRLLASKLGSTLKDIRQDLDALGGISIYRDNFRVLPYGEPQNDWLRLDLRRVQTPTLRISNNQVIGYISISLHSNPAFIDQSNREGLVDSQAFTDLQEITKAILNQLETRRYVERRVDNDIESRESLFTNFDVKKYLNVISQKHPNDIEIKDALQKTEESINTGVKKVQEVLSQYRRLSTLGLLVDVILHDGNNYLLKMDGELKIIYSEIKKEEKNIDEIIIGLNNINTHRKLFAQLFKRLEPFGGRKKGRPKDLILEEAIKNVFALYEHELEKNNVSYILPDSENWVKIDEGELQFIFINLLQNSIYWLEGSTNKNIIVEVTRNNDDLNVIFSDSGPGIEEEYQSSIFDPYFSTKPNGVGLGLAIIGELITEYDGSLSLINNGPLDGATFKLTFKTRI